MKKPLAIILSLLMLGCPSAVAARGKVTTLSKGQPAPFTGTLLDKEASASILNEKIYLEEQIELRVKQTVELESLRLQYKIDSLTLELRYLQKMNEEIATAKDKQIAFLDKELQKSTSPNNELWFGGGVIVGIAVTVLGAWALNEALK